MPPLYFLLKVIAREDKGWRGVEYNKSPETLFSTSLRQGNLNPVHIPRNPEKESIPAKEKGRIGDQEINTVQVFNDNNNKK